MSHPDGREATGGQRQSVILMAAKRPEDLLLPPSPSCVLIRPDASG